MPARVSVVLLGDAAMGRLHRRFIGDPEPTDVLSFDLRGPSSAPNAPEAEIAIGVEVAAREAARRRVPAEREVRLYLIHGLLHLSGFDDHDARDRARMRRAERRVLAALERRPTPSGATGRRAAARPRGR